MNVYFAGPLFSEAEKNWIAKTMGQIETTANKSELPLHYSLLALHLITSKNLCPSGMLLGFLLTLTLYA